MTTVTLILCYLAVSAIIASLCHFYWTKRRLYAASYNYDGPIAYPIIGNGISLIGHNDKILMKLYNIIESYKPKPMRFWLGPILALIFTSPDHAEKILSSSKFVDKHDLYKFLKIFIGNGLVSGSGSNHKLHRRIIQPMVNLNFVLIHLDIVQKHVNSCMANLNDFVGKKTFNILEPVHKCFNNIVKELIFGIEVKSQVHGKSEFDQVIVEVYKMIFTRITKAHLQNDLIFDMTPLKERQTKYRNIIRDLVRKFIREAQEKRNLQLGKTSFNPIINQMNEFLEENPDFFDEDTFIDHVLTLYVAAEDTLTVITAFLVICLGMNPQYQTKAAEEVRSLFGKKQSPTTPEDFKNLRYIDMCIKDVLRLFPIAPYILRKTSEDVYIEKWLIPPGSAVVVPIFNIHRNPMFWKKPHDFYPDHFLPEEVKRRHVYAYIPFSAGSRGCIGKHVAYAFLKTFICSFLQKYEVAADGKVPDLKLKMDISVRSIDGYNVRLKQRV